MAGPYNFTDLVVTATDDKAVTPNSATLPLYQGDLQISGLVPGGQTIEISESKGHVVGARKAARARPTISFSGLSSGLQDAFAELVGGFATGTVSTSLSIGDAHSVDLSIIWTLATVAHTITAADCILTSFDEGDGSAAATISYSFEVLGAFTIDGNAWVAAL